MTDKITWGAEFRDDVFCLYNVNEHRVLRFEASITGYLSDLHVKYDTTWLDTYGLEIGILKDVLRSRGFEVATTERELYEIDDPNIDDQLPKGIETILNLEPTGSADFDVEGIWRSFLEELRRKGISTSRDFIAGTIRELVSGDPSRNPHLKKLHEARELCYPTRDVKRVNRKEEPLSSEDLRLLNGETIPTHASGLESFGFAMGARD
jgi:hypothetical protein